jgi:hypothetical protein
VISLKLFGCAIVLVSVLFKEAHVKSLPLVVCQYDVVHWRQHITYSVPP